MNLLISDIDGTFTQDGVDLWYEFHKMYIYDKSILELELKILQENISENPIKQSEITMRRLMHYFLKNDYEEFIGSLDCSKTVRSDAMEFCEDWLKRGNRIVFSTGNYQCLAKLFISTLFDEKLHNQIEVQGSIVDWGLREVRFANVYTNKTIRLPDLNLFENILAVGDDPVINDKYLLRLTENSFLINTTKNSILDFPRKVDTWGEIPKFT